MLMPRTGLPGRLNDNATSINSKIFFMPTEASRNKKRGEPDTNLFIYRLGLARVDKKLVRVLAGKFNLLKKGLTSTFIETEEVFKFQSGGELLVINKSTGAFRLINKSLWQVDDGKSDLREITDAKAVKIASAYVEFDRRWTILA